MDEKPLYKKGLCYFNDTSSGLTIAFKGCKMILSIKISVDEIRQNLILLVSKDCRYRNILLLICAFSRNTSRRV
jgi:hypothetical protein